MFDDQDLWILRRIFDLEGRSINSLALKLRDEKRYPLISDITRVSKPTLLKRLRKLADEGFVRIERDMRHRQKKICRLTEKGRDLITSIIIPLETWVEGYRRLMRGVLSGKEKEMNEVLSSLLIGMYYVLKGIVYIMRLGRRSSGLLLGFILRVAFAIINEINELRKNEQAFTKFVWIMERNFPALRTLRESGFNLLKDIEIL